MSPGSTVAPGSRVDDGSRPGPPRLRLGADDLAVVGEDRRLRRGTARPVERRRRPSRPSWASSVTPGGRFRLVIGVITLDHLRATFGPCAAPRTSSRLWRSGAPRRCASPGHAIAGDPLPRPRQREDDCQGPSMVGPWASCSATSRTGSKPTARVYPAGLVRLGERRLRPDPVLDPAELAGLALVPRRRRPSCRRSARLGVVMVPKVEGRGPTTSTGCSPSSGRRPADPGDPRARHPRDRARRRERRGDLHASPRMQGLSLGPADLAASRRMKTTRVGGGHPGYVVRADPTSATPSAPGDRAAGPLALHPRPDGGRLRHGRDLPVLRAFGDIGDPVGCEDQFRAAFLLGCVGAWSLHPSQIAIGKRVFSPSADDVAHARRVVAAMGDRASAVMLDGRMEDDASLKQCLVLLDLAEPARRPRPGASRGRLVGGSARGGRCSTCRPPTSRSRTRPTLPVHALILDLEVPPPMRSHLLRTCCCAVRFPAHTVCVSHDQGQLAVILGHDDLVGGCAAGRTGSSSRRSDG